MGWLTGKKITWDEVAVIENEARVKEMERINLENEGKTRGIEYQNMMTAAQREARTEAEGAITSERTQGIKDSSQTITDFDAQERRRFFEAKKGTGQVSAEDTSITGDMVKGAREFLGRGSDYWDARRLEAGDQASKNGLARFTKEYGTEQDYIGKGSLLLAANKVADEAAKKEAPKVDEITALVSRLPNLLEGAYNFKENTYSPAVKKTDNYAKKTNKLFDPSRYNNLLYDPSRYN